MYLQSKQPKSLPDAMSLSEFYDALSGFDWYYDFSDDYSVYNSGRRREAELSKLAKQSSEHQALFDAWSKHMFTGKAWGNERAPKPERPS